MTTNAVSTIEKLKKVWSISQSIPGGKWFFSKFIGFVIPYSGSINAKIIELSPGNAAIQLNDNRKVRNHLNSIHAIALINLGELCSGLALNMGLANNVRGIVTEIRIEYFKKARGNLLAKCNFDVPVVNKKMDYWLETNIHDQTNDIVASTQVCWRLDLKEES